MVEGVVRLADGAELPTLPRGADPNQPAPPEHCSPPREEDRRPVSLDEGRGLVGVLVTGAGFGGWQRREPVEHAVVIRDCRLSPRLVVAMRGDRLRLTNETDYPFLPGFGPGGFLQALLRGESRTLTLDRRVAALECHFAAPCGRTDVVMLEHDVYAITGAGGRFRIERFPTATTDVELHAWHPLFESDSRRIRVEPGARLSVELVLRPAPPEPEPPSRPLLNPDGTDIPREPMGQTAPTAPPPQGRGGQRQRTGGAQSPASGSPPPSPTKMQPARVGELPAPS